MEIETAGSVPLRLPGNDEGALLRIVGLRHSVDSFEIRVFFGPLPPEAERSGALFIGSVWMYGLGRPRSPAEPLPITAPWDLTLPVPRAALAAARSAGAASISFALVDATGKALASAVLTFDHVELEGEGS
jgi:hypothetical protein